MSTPRPALSLRGGRRILLVRLGAVGDVVRALPLAHALRRHDPDALLGWAVEEASASLLHECRALDVVHVLPRRQLVRSLGRPRELLRALSALREFVRALRAARYERVLDVHGTLKAALVARLADAEVTGLAPGGSKEMAHLLHDRSVPFPSAPMSRVRRALHLGAAADLLGEHPCTDEGSAAFGLTFPGQRVVRMHALLEADPRRPIVLFPFASAKGARKRWPIASHAKLGSRLATLGHRVLMAWGSPREGEEARAALQSLPGATACPPTDLVELTELLRGACVLVTGDTGPMHLAAAVGTPVVALFGPSDPEINRPWGHPPPQGHAILVRQPLTELTVDEVLPHVLARAGAAADARPE